MLDQILTTKTPEEQPTIVCARCSAQIPAPAPSAITPGYGINVEGQKICYSCCAELDREFMRANGKITLYLTGVMPKIRRGYSVNPAWRITNWPGSLHFTPLGNRVKIGAHNMGVDRYDVWFVFEGWVWHGVNIGNYSELLHCKRTKTPDPSAPKPPRKHWVGMAGLHGCLPNFCDVFQTRGAAAQCLGQIHELSGRAIAKLRRDQYFELDLYEHGNEYCEITECNCNDPGVHSDSPIDLEDYS